MLCLTSGSGWLKLKPEYVDSLSDEVRISDDQAIYSNKLTQGGGGGGREGVIWPPPPIDFPNGCT